MEKFHIAVIKHTSAPFQNAVNLILYKNNEKLLKAE